MWIKILKECFSHAFRIFLDPASARTDSAGCTSVRGPWSQEGEGAQDLSSLLVGAGRLLARQGQPACTEKSIKIGVHRDSIREELWRFKIFFPYLLGMLGSRVQGSGSGEGAEGGSDENIFSFVGTDALCWIW